MKKSRIPDEMHETARGLQRAGAIDKRTMRDFDALCVPRALDGAAAHELSRRHDRTGEVTIMKPQPITDAGYAAALAAGRTEAETELRAQSVRYVPDRDAIELVVNRNAGFLIPRAWIGALQSVPAKDLLKLDVWPDGSAIEIDELDIQISVHGLLSAILPAMLPARTVAAIFASRGGQATSAAKRSSAQANGRKGGRPRKATRAA